MRKPQTLREWIEWAEEIDIIMNGDNECGQWDIPLDDTEGNYEKFKDITED